MLSKVRNHGNKASGIGHWASGIEHRASGIGHLPQKRVVDGRESCGAVPQISRYTKNTVFFVFPLRKQHFLKILTWSLTYNEQ
jgi:hypothetical protein